MKYNSYYTYQKYENRGGQGMIPVYPNVYSIDADETLQKRLHKESDNCCSDVPPIYRTISGTPYCAGYDKYVDVYNQISYDNGETWETTSSAETLVERNSEYCGYDFTHDYLTFVALEDGTFKFNGSFSTNTLYYSLDGGETWTLLSDNTNTPTITAGNEIKWKASGLTTPSSSEGMKGIGTFSSTGDYDVKGNTMSLLYWDDFEDKTSLGINYAFTSLFSGSTGVINTKNMVLPATTLSLYCYSKMFDDCSNLITTPKLSATTITDYCYNNMFSGCTSLTTAPELPASTMKDYCYTGMFAGCTSLTTAPVLSSTTLAEGCYYEMFQGCTSLTTAPTLSARIMKRYCYAGMFSGCTSLTTASELPATTLEYNCYGYMFYGCSSLTTAPVLSATTMKDYCYSGMFRDCSSLTTAPSVLPATTLAQYCYSQMFQGCTSLTTAPTLSATTLAKGCCGSMFSGCASLTTAPELPASTMKEYCYSWMFYNCSSLSYIKCLATSISANGCTNGWVGGVSSTGTFVKASSMSGWSSGSSGIPSGWTVQNAT